jgi:glyoxylate/hydroxypyruvate reductase
MPVAFFARLPPAAVQRWHELLSDALAEPLAADPAEADIAVAANPEPGALARLSNLRFVQSAWAGVDGLLADSTLPRVPVARLIDPALAADMAQAVAGHVIALHRNTLAYRDQQARREWRQLPQLPMAERSIGLLGHGEMGKACARALTALGFPVSAWSRSSGDLDRLLAESAIVVNLLPLTAETREILDADLFARMRPGAAIISVGRGGHLREADLIPALDSGQLSHAVLDVFAVEPLPADHPFWAHPKITVTPHIAAVTDPANSARLIAANIARFRAGEPVEGLVSRDAGY